MLFCPCCHILVSCKRCPGSHRRCVPARTVEIVMFNWIDSIPYTLIILIAVFMLLAPFRPLPHVVEKLIMLKNGTLSKPIDLFDLVFHLVPTVLLIIKIVRDAGR